MVLIDFLQLNPFIFYVLVVLLGLVVGSFLNVVIIRLPKMMERSWRTECCQLLEIEPDAGPHRPLNLFFPRSHCLACGAMVRAVDNIPVISFLCLKGRCRHCQAKIAYRYPLIESVSAILSCGIALYFGPSAQCVAALLLSWVLLCLSVIDIDHQLLPDSITLPMLWCGLICNSFGLFTDIYASLFGAVIGYLGLWSVFVVFKALTGKEGMGYGDFKLLAMLGAWLGWQMLPLILIVSSLSGSVIGIAMILLKGDRKDTPIPFGPYLAIAGWVALLWGENINFFYLNWVVSGYIHP